MPKLSALPKLNWSDVEDILRSSLVSKGIQVFMYQNVVLCFNQILRYTFSKGKQPKEEKKVEEEKQIKVGKLQNEDKMEIGKSETKYALDQDTDSTIPMDEVVESIIPMGEVLEPTLPFEEVAKYSKSKDYESDEPESMTSKVSFSRYVFIYRNVQ
jgi:hypothetical protein